MLLVLLMSPVESKAGTHVECINRTYQGESCPSAWQSSHAETGKIGCQQDHSPKKPQTIVLSRKKISEIKFKPAEEQNQQSSNGLQAVQKRIHSSLPAGQKRALCSCLPNSGMTLLCQCFPFSYKACPGIPRAGRVREPSRAPGQGLTRLGAKRNNRLGNEAPSCFSMCRQQNANIFQAGLYRVAHGRTKGPGEDGQRRPTMRLVAK